MEFTTYPLQFHPILKDKIWGGNKLKSLLNKPSSSATTGESWEISTVEGDISIVAEGIYKGKDLNELIQNYPNEILGHEVYKKFGKEFPLLFKFIDAADDLSIQVHPNDDLARSRHNSFGKTEMWYIMQADDDARIIVGFKKQSNASEYVEHLENNKLVDILHQQKVHQGDVFFLETGTIHAIGAGVLLAEIQQTSDITYRVYDWDRKDSEGNSRDLHTDLALEAMNYDFVNTQQDYKKDENTVNVVVDCPYFTTCFLPLHGTMDFIKNGSSFVVLMCVSGVFTIETSTSKIHLVKGQTVLLPAALSSYSISGKASILEIYIS
ncbi:MAG TPA: type I phosphomannose isomerase catalytic subunit [Flavobacterium sp.]